MMKANLIHLYLLSVIACLVSSCSSDSPDTPPTASGEEMVLTINELSRAAVTNELSSFVVYGNMKFTNSYPVLIFDRTDVSYTDGHWSYGDKQYWMPSHEYSFVAFNPIDAEGVADTKYHDSRLSFTYTTPDDFTSVSDLLAATHRRKYIEEFVSPATPVAFNFHHIMSRIDFHVKNDKAADVITVTKIELDGVYKTGVFGIAPAAILAGRQTDDCVCAWSDISNKRILTTNISVDIPEDQTRSLFPDNNALFVIPQPDNKDVILHITYILKDSGAAPEELTLVAETPIGGWEIGKIYTYSLNISELSQEIYVTVSVKDWKSQSASNIIVPEY